MTKKEAAARVFYVAQKIREKAGDDEDAPVWVFLLEYVAVDLDPKNLRYLEAAAAEIKPSVRSKLRRLIEHPATPMHEREAAVRAMHKLDGLTRYASEVSNPAISPETASGNQGVGGFPGHTEPNQDSEPSA